MAKLKPTPLRDPRGIFDLEVENPPKTKGQYNILTELQKVVGSAPNEELINFILQKEQEASNLYHQAANRPVSPSWQRELGAGLGQLLQGAAGYSTGGAEGGLEGLRSGEEFKKRQLGYGEKEAGARSSSLLESGNLKSKQMGIAPQLFAQSSKVNPYELKKFAHDLRMSEKEAGIPIARKTAAARARGEQDVRGTRGQQMVDNQFGKTYEKWVAQGGLASSLRNIEQLNSAWGRISDAIKNKTNISGVDMALLPENAKLAISPEGVDIERLIGGVVQQTLRETLGGQFAEREGRDLLRRVYNPGLSPERNLASVKLYLNQLKLSAGIKQQLVKEWQDKGSIKDFKFKPITIMGKKYNLENYDLDKDSTDNPLSPPSKQLTEKDIDNMDEAAIKALEDANK